MELILETLRLTILALLALSGTPIPQPQPEIDQPLPGWMREGKIYRGTQEEQDTTPPRRVVCKQRIVPSKYSTPL